MRDRKKEREINLSSDLYLKKRKKMTDMNDKMQG
jgi:hypothetical protein